MRALKRLELDFARRRAPAGIEIIYSLHDGIDVFGGKTVVHRQPQETVGLFRGELVVAVESPITSSRRRRVQGDVMKRRGDAPLLEKGLQLGPLSKIGCLYIEHVSIVLAAIGNEGQPYATIRSKVGQTMPITAPRGETIPVDLSGALELTP